MNRFSACVFLSAICLTFTPDAGAVKISAEKVGFKINITIDGKFFTSYIFSQDEKYPFFFPVNGPATGSSVTSMRNGEYPHHSSLFFGCDMVNGGNYWQEGLERGRIISVNAQILKQGGDTVIITDECIWSRPGALSPVKDTRKFIITAPSPGKYQIDAEIVMEMLQDVRILKTNHSLFSVRTAPDISVRRGGTMVNAEGLKGEKDTFGQKSAWMDYSGRRGDITEGICVMQHPSNPWYPAPWFTRDYGFISPTPMYWPENGKDIFLERGSSLRLLYRVIVHSGSVTDADLKGEFEKYKSF